MSQTSYSVAIADNSNAPKSAPFVDAWSYMQSQRRLSFEEESEEVLHKREGFTFPACNPVKRIDFIMVRNHSHRLQERTFTAQIIDFRIEGTKPSADTGIVVFPVSYLCISCHCFTFQCICARSV